VVAERAVLCMTRGSMPYSYTALAERVQGRERAEGESKTPALAAPAFRVIFIFSFFLEVFGSNEHCKGRRVRGCRGQSCCLFLKIQRGGGGVVVCT